MENRYPAMGPGGPSRPSELAMNPRNQEAKATRRGLLLSAFDELDPDTRATLLELAETWAFRATAAVNTESYDARVIVRRMYAAIGWEPKW